MFLIHISSLLDNNVPSPNTYFLPSTLGKRAKHTMTYRPFETTGKSLCSNLPFDIHSISTYQEIKLERWFLNTKYTVASLGSNRNGN